MKKEDAVRKIKAMKKMTVANGASEQEAMIALDRMNKMLLDFNLSLKEIDIDESQCHYTEFDPRIRKSHPIEQVIAAISLFTDTKATKNKRVSRHITYGFFGLKPDTVVAAYLIEVIYNAMESEYKVFLKEYKKTDEYKYRRVFHINAVKTSFMAGMAYRLIQRIREMIEARKPQYHSNGTDLVILKNSVVDAEWDKIHDKPLKVEKPKQPEIKDNTALRAGYLAGGNVELNPAIDEDNKSE